MGPAKIKEKALIGYYPQFRCFFSSSPEISRIHISDGTSKAPKGFLLPHELVMDGRHQLIGSTAGLKKESVNVSRDSSHILRIQMTKKI